jgi:MFS transporter, NNP family, nitrate/nitrite transporter
MKLAELTRIGHWPTVVASFIYLTVSFMAWVSLGPLIIYITEGMGVSVEWRLRLLAIPILSGSLLRIPLGVLADRVGTRLTGLCAQLTALLSIGGACVFGLSNPFQLTLFAAFLGVPGAAFSVAIPQASRWYPANYQGLVMGIVGSGNMGVAIVALYAPWVSETYGWRTAYGVLLALMISTLLYYLVAARDAPALQVTSRRADLIDLVFGSDSLWLMFFYFITFGGFVGLASILPLLFNAQYQTSGMMSGFVAAITIFLGSLSRPVGGHVADRIGGARTLIILLGFICVAYLAAAFLTGLQAPPDQVSVRLFGLSAHALMAAMLFSLTTVCLGMGNGAVFQLIGQRFRNEIGVMAGVVGAAGGFGGFFLAQALAFSREATGEFRLGFAMLGLLALAGLVGVRFTKPRWRAAAHVSAP